MPTNLLLNQFSEEKIDLKEERKSQNNKKRGKPFNSNSRDVPMIYHLLTPLMEKSLMKVIFCNHDFSIASIFVSCRPSIFVLMKYHELEKPDLPIDLFYDERYINVSVFIGSDGT